MKGKIKLDLFEKGDKVGETVTDFYFRLRDLESFFMTDEDEIVAMIGRVERVFQFDEELERVLREELSGVK